MSNIRNHLGHGWVNPIWKKMERDYLNSSPSESEEDNGESREDKNRDGKD